MKICTMVISIFRRIAIILAFVLAVNTSYTQHAWHWQNPLPQGNHLNDIQAVTSNAGFAAGQQGSFLKTVSAGKDWQLLEFRRLMSINKIHFVTENAGWVTGAQGELVYLYQTSNGGMTWTGQMESEAQYISACFLDENVGWVAIDSTVYQTVDGGTNWDPLSLISPVSYMYFHDASTGWAVGDSWVYRTTDGGNSWQYTTLEVYGDWFSLHKVKFVNANIGWVIGSSSAPNHYSGHLLKTTDGGRTWDQQLEVGMDFIDYRSFTDIEFQDDILGWAISPGQVYRTTNGGTHWEQVAKARYLTQVSAIDDSVLWGAGYYGTLYTSSDSGSTWEEQFAGTIGPLKDLIIVNENIGFAGGGKTLLKTVNGGEVWEKIDVVEFWQSNCGILSVWFTDSLKGWIGCTLGGGRGGLSMTTDGGYTWTNQLDNVRRIFDIYFVNDIEGWAVSGTEIYHTQDGGNSWTLQLDQEYIGELESIFFATPDSGWAGGYLGLIKTTDGGYNWIPVYLNGVGLFVKHIHFINSLEGWVVGYTGNYSYIFKTIDGGMSWESQTHPKKPYAWAQSVYFTDSDHGWVVGTGFGGMILYTSNGGELWERVAFPADLDLYRVEFASRNHGWIIGDGGSILHTPIDITPVKGDVSGDATINVMDVMEVINHIIGLQILEGEAFNRADCNADGQINVLDVVGIVNMILGIFDDLYGTWVRTGYDENITILRKSEELDDNEYGFIIYPDGKFIERKNAGWCATPPITYANFEGGWKRMSQNLLDITVGYWGGITSYQMEIVSLTPGELKILYHYSDQDGH
ncbi:MAG: YCF48-related protein [bacterium]